MSANNDYLNLTPSHIAPLAPAQVVVVTPQRARDALTWTSA